MRKEKPDFSGIKAEAIKISEDEAAKDFINGALRNKTMVSDPVGSNMATSINAGSRTSNEKTPKKGQQKKLVVEGLLKNRNEICEKPIQLYVRKELASWIDTYASSGGQQIMLNYLIKRGIEAVEEQYKVGGIIFTDES